MNEMDIIVNEMLEYLTLNEFDIDNDVEYDEVDSKTYKFTVGDKIYHIEYIASLTPDKKLIYDFKFKLVNNPKSPKRSNFKDERQYDIAVRNSQIGITGTGDSFKIFSKVISIIIKILNKKNPDYINFQANEENRQRLYKLLIKSVIKKFPIYMQIDTDPITNQPLSDGDFWLQKIEKL